MTTWCNHRTPWKRSRRQSWRMECFKVGWLTDNTCVRRCLKRRITKQYPRSFTLDMFSHPKTCPGDWKRGRLWKCCNFWQLLGLRSYFGMRSVRTFQNWMDAFDRDGVNSYRCSEWNDNYTLHQLVHNRFNSSLHAHWFRIDRILNIASTGNWRNRHNVKQAHFLQGKGSNYW